MTRSNTAGQQDSLPVDGWCEHAKPVPTGGGVLLVVLCAMNFLDAMDVSSMGPTLPKSSTH